MTADGLLVVHCLFQTIWSIFTSWQIPGTAVTPAMMGVFLIVAGIGLRIFIRILGSGSSAAVDAVKDYQFTEERRYRNWWAGKDTPKHK